MEIILFIINIIVAVIFIDRAIATKDSKAASTYALLGLLSLMVGYVVLVVCLIAQVFKFFKSKNNEEN